MKPSQRFLSFAADRSLSAFSPTHRTELWTLPLLRKPGSRRGRLDIQPVAKQMQNFQN